MAGRRGASSLPDASAASGDAVRDDIARRLVCIRGMRPLRNRQAKSKRRADAFLPVGGNRSPVATDDAFDGGETDARSFEFVASMKARERPEQLVRQARI